MGISFIAAASITPAATIGFSVGDFVSFQSSVNVQLEGGYLHAGYYESSPLGLGLGAADLQSDFNTWATHESTSGLGGFNSTNFPTTSLGAAAGQQIFLVVTDTLLVSDASLISVFTNTSDSDWVFPTSESDIDPTRQPVSLDDIVLSIEGSEILAGTEVTTSNLQDFLGRDTQAIQLVPVPEPSVMLLGTISLCGIFRRRRSQ